MKRKIRITTEVDVEFIDDIYLGRAGELGDLIGEGVALTRAVRLLVSEDAAVDHLGAMHTVAWEFVI